MARPGSGGGGREHRKFYTVLYFLQNKTSHFSNANLVQDNLAFLLLFHLYPHTPTPLFFFLQSPKRTKHTRSYARIVKLNLSMFF